MANNLIVSYDLVSPNQNYSKVIAAVKALGSWAKVDQSVWYVNSAYTASQAVDHIAAAMAGNDKVFVADASNNNAAWNVLPAEVAEHIISEWNT